MEKATSERNDSRPPRHPLMLPSRATRQQRPEETNGRDGRGADAVGTRAQLPQQERRQLQSEMGGEAAKETWPRPGTAEDREFLGLDGDKAARVVAPLEESPKSLPLDGQIDGHVHSQKCVYFLSSN